MVSSKVITINNFIQSFLESNDLDSITPVRIAVELEKVGILKDSRSRPGLPLRRLIRDGKINGAWQDESKRWHIDRVAEHVEKYSIQQVARLCGYKSEQPIYNKIKSNKIPYEFDEQSNIYFRKDIIEEWINSNVKLPVSKPTFSQISINRLINSVRPLLDFLNDDTKNVINLIDSITNVTDDRRVIRKLELIKELLQEAIQSFSYDLNQILYGMGSESN